MDEEELRFLIEGEKGSYLDQVSQDEYSPELIELLVDFSDANKRLNEKYGFSLPEEEVGILISFSFN